MNTHALRLCETAQWGRGPRSRSGPRPGREWVAGRLLRGAVADEDEEGREEPS